MYKKPIRDLVELKQRMVAVWADYEQTIVDKAIDHGENDFGLVYRLKDNTLNSCFNWKCLHC